MTKSEKELVERLMSELAAAARTLRRIEEDARREAEVREQNLSTLRDREA